MTVVTLDTGVSADGYIEWCKAQAMGRYSPFVVWDNPDVGFEWYVNNAYEHGYGYTRQHHNTMYYRMLKERTIAKILRHYKKHRHDRVMFISGVYRAESMARRNLPETERHGAAVWVSPCVHWQKSDFIQYRATHELPDNPFYGTVGGSGDCQCNWGQFISLDELYTHSPRLALKLKAVDSLIVARHGWGYGQAPSAGLQAERAGQMVLPGIAPLAPNLCEGCQRVKPQHNDALDDLIMQRFDWSA
jgi:hypothetical protein